MHLDVGSFFFLGRLPALFFASRVQIADCATDASWPAVRLGPPSLLLSFPPHITHNAPALLYFTFREALVYNDYFPSLP